MSPTKREHNGIVFSLAWADMKWIVPTVLAVLGWGSMAGVSSGMVPGWGSPRSSANTMAIAKLNIQMAERTKEQQELAKAMIRLEVTTAHVKKTVDRIDNELRHHRIARRTAPTDTE